MTTEVTETVHIPLNSAVYAFGAFQGKRPHPQRTGRGPDIESIETTAASRRVRQTPSQDRTQRTKPTSRRKNNSQRRSTHA